MAFLYDLPVNLLELRNEVLITHDLHNQGSRLGGDVFLLTPDVTSSEVTSSHPGCDLGSKTGGDLLLIDVTSVKLEVTSF